MSERLFSAKSKRFARPLRIAIGVLVSLLVIYIMLPRPPRPEERSLLGLSEGRRIASSLTLKTSAPLSDSDLAFAQWGRELYHDRRISPDGSTSCADCHDAAVDRTVQAPPLVNLANKTWFFHDGRQDNLVGAVLSSLEDPAASGSNRLRVAHLVAGAYAANYSTTFEPPEIDPSWPADGYPHTPADIALPLEIASEALATLTHYELLASILQTARERHQAPVTEMIHRAIRLPVKKQDWVNAYDSLDEKQQQQVTTVFIRTGAAIAAYLRTRQSAPSAFDQFAADLASGKSLDQSFRSDFHETHWRGLAIFASDDGCIRCHHGPDLRNEQFHNIGLEGTTAEMQLGRTSGIVRLQNTEFTCTDPRMKAFVHNAAACEQRAHVTLERPQQLGAYATPSLRHLRRSAPYLHDGRAPHLQAVLRYYSHLPDRAAVGWRSSLLEPMNFTEQEFSELTAFLMSLDSAITELDGVLLGAQISSK